MQYGEPSTGVPSYIIVAWFQSRAKDRLIVVEETTNAWLTPEFACSHLLSVALF